jgi:hypothetical protein
MDERPKWVAWFEWIAVIIVCGGGLLECFGVIK